MRRFFWYLGLGLGFILAGEIVVWHTASEYPISLAIAILLFIVGACFMGMVIYLGSEAQTENEQRRRIFQKIEPNPHDLTCDKCGATDFICTMSYGMGQLELKCTKCGQSHFFLYPKYVDDYVSIPQKGCSV